MDHPAAAAASGEFVVGCRLAIKTTLGDDFEGHVLTFDKSSNVVVLHILPPHAFRALSLSPSLSVCVDLCALSLLVAAAAADGRIGDMRSSAAASRPPREHQCCFSCSPSASFVHAVSLSVQ